MSPAVCFTERTRADGRNLETLEDQSYALTNPGAGRRCHCRQLMQGMAVRRLTPVECERLQGFPDDYTRIPWRGKPAEECPDGPRYKALGNSMAVPVMRWIGRRLLMVEEILSESQSTARSLPKGAGDA
jgi:DNA (cytosine-5)-methyltransferase 1